ncbi:Hypothetical predicted protein [Mytilus galloprovincialis]|uniref:Uncharacterized protein n=2 Tax=Mytilus galloprovincialis TaxID=29158 RepID=A0A8B6FV78_MYTGA|nr:Hypothetical predicted protein [Mytilus galloprovincialis]
MIITVRCIDRSIIQVMNLTGKVIRTIPVPLDHIRDITVDRDRLVCIDSNTSVYCYSLDGKLIWKFKKDDYTEDFRRVTSDNKGNIYTTNTGVNTVVVIYDKGQHQGKLLTGSVGIDGPHGIFFDKKENILLVCNLDKGSVFLFDVKDK